jgi:four helix bundle protein
MINFRPHKKLLVWQKAMDFVTLIYGVTDGFPRNEEFGLKSQLRRAAVSVPSCIAEGLTRKSRAGKLHFLNIVLGSLSEIDAQ